MIPRTSEGKIDMAAVRDAISVKDRIEQLTGVRLSIKENSPEGTHWKGPCPMCGGKDRFMVNERTNRFFCRQCHAGESSSGGWGDGIEFVKAWKPGISFRDAVELWTGELVADPASLKEAAEQRRKLAEAEQLKAEAERAEKRAKILKNLDGGQLYQRWHEGMNDEQRALWANRGIPNDFQKMWKLGYVADLPHELYRVPLEVITDAPEHRSALSIPYPKADGYGQFRYIIPNGHGPYHNLSMFQSVPFVTQPDRQFDQVIVHEGAIKAMNGFIWGCGEEWQVIGAPSMSALDCVVPLLKCSKKAVLWFDPDTFIKPENAKDTWRPAPLILAALLRQVYKDLDIRIVSFPLKSDDAQLGTMQSDQYLRIVQSARPYERWK